MASLQSVTMWIADLKDGSEAAVQKIWERFSPGIRSIARRKLADDRRRVADTEDIAQSAFFSFWKGAVGGRFSQLRDQGDLLALLTVITERTVLDYQKRERRQKRGSGCTRGESVIESGGPDSLPATLDRFVGNDRTPDSIVAHRQVLENLLDRLGDDTLRRIAVWNLEGHTNAEIAEMLGCARTTVVRKMSLIRRRWAAELPQ